MCACVTHKCVGFYSYTKEPNFSKMIYKTLSFWQKGHDMVNLIHISNVNSTFISAGHRWTLMPGCVRHANWLLGEMLRLKQKIIYQEETFANRQIYNECNPNKYEQKDCHVSSWQSAGASFLHQYYWFLYKPKINQVETRVCIPFQLQWHHQWHNFLLSRPTWHPDHQHSVEVLIASAMIWTRLN